MTTCYCGAIVSDGEGKSAAGIAPGCQAVCDELAIYTLSQGYPEFIHQYVVDAYAAQHAPFRTKPIAVAFALIGLYIVFERGGVGKDSQDAHIRLAQLTKDWPTFTPPLQKAKLTVVDVMRLPPGPERDDMIRQWARSVWDMWEKEHGAVKALFESFEK